MNFKNLKFAVIGMMALRIPAVGAEFLFSSRLQSQYIAGNGAVFYDKPVAQNDIFISFPNGIYADIWHSTSLDFPGLNHGQDDEIDYTIGCVRPFEKFTIDFGMLYMNFEDLSKSRGDSILPYLELSRTAGKKVAIIPYARIQLAIPISGSTPKQGYYIAAGLSFLNQQKKKSEIRHKISIIRDSGAFGYEQNIIGEYKFELSKQLGKRAKLILPSVFAYIPLSRPSEYDGRKTSVSVGSGLSISF